MRWFHGTSKQNAEQILKEGVLKPGQDSIYDVDVPRYDAVYVTSEYQIAKFYAEERGEDGVVFEVAVNESKLLPDEDSVYDALHSGAVVLGTKKNKQLGQAIREAWLKHWKSIDGEGDTWEEAWEAWGNVEAEGSSGIAEEMKDLTEEIHRENPALSKAIIEFSGKAAHIGPVKVKKMIKSAKKKPDHIKTPGFIIEVPHDHRKGFFTAPKAPLVYWAFKNRPRVFIKEKLIFTFNGKPVAEALVAKIEGPGKGEGEYKRWHKVYWKPTTFKRFHVGADPYLYHVTLQRNVDDILEQGLKAEHGYQFFDDTPKSTYLTEKLGLPFWKDEIASYYGEPQVVRKVDRQGLNLIPDEQGSADAGAPAYRVEQDIPADMIKIAAAPAVAKQRAIDTPQFKAWFGDSKVVDKNGEPLVVYHGTVHDFDTFSLDRPLSWEWQDMKDIGSVGHGEGRSQAIIMFNKNDNQWDLYPDGGKFPTMQAAKDKVEAERPKTDLITLRPGFFFAGNPMYTHDFTYSYDPGGRDATGANVKACYLRMENPLDFREARSRRWVRDWLRMNMPKLPHLDPKHVYKVFREGNWAFVEGIQNEAADAQDLSLNLIRDIKQAGFDGYITVEGGHLRFVEQSDADYDARAKEMYGRGGLDSSIVYVVWSPYQIKSVFNSGAFDPKNPSITASKTAGQQVELYHGTTWDAADQILKQGLKASPWKVKGKTGKFVWCSSTYDQAAEYGMSAGWDIGGEVGNYAVVSFKWDWDKTEPDPEHELAIEQDIYRRIPNDIPASAIVRIDYYNEEYGQPVKSIKKTADYTDEQGYWAGEGGGASGILPVCPQKGTVCLAWRSKYVQTPDCWGTIGGAVQRGKSPAESAKAELGEETGYHGGMTLIPAYTFTDGSFSYQNYIGVVSNEFPFAPKPLSREEHMVLKSRLQPEQYYQLIPGWETDHIQWVKYATVLDDMNENPEDYHPGLLKLFKNSKDAIERALKVEPPQEKKAAHSPRCDCEMCRSIPEWQRPWLTGHCDEFALALHQRMPDAEFVVIGAAMHDHVGLKKGDKYYDVRGGLTLDQFTALFGSNANDVHPASYETVMQKAGYASWVGHEDEFWALPDMKKARAVVNRVFRGKIAKGMNPYPTPMDVSRRPCPSGKRKFYDQMSAVGQHKRWDEGTPNLRAYKCPKCGWWHLTSKPERFLNPAQRMRETPVTAAGQMDNANFRQWFQGSKVVDKNGNPMPVYHGTRSSVDFEEFSVDGPPQMEDSYEGETTSSGSGWDPTAYLGAHFAEEPNVASAFAMGEGWQKSRYEGEDPHGRVIQVYLRVTNPKDFGSEYNLRKFIYQGKITDDDVLGIGCRVETGYNPWEGDEQENSEAQKEIDAYYQKYENDQAYRAKENEYLIEQYRPMDMEDDMLRSAAYDLAMQAAHKLRQSGHDGIRYQNVVEGGHAWVVFDPRQIKSINAQEFNPRDPRFTASVESDATEIKIVPKSKGLEAEAWYGGQRVGFVYLHKMEDAPGNPRAPKNSLMVDAAALGSHLKGKSIGLKMYRAAIAAAQEAGFDRVYEGIEHSNDAANLWERLKQLYPTEFDEDWGVYYIPLQGLPKEADWKRNVLLPAALTLGLGAPGTSPSEITPQQQQVLQQQRHQNQMEKMQESQLDDLVEAISRAEGAKPELNNPGDLADFNTGKIRKFDTYEQGEQALRDQLVSMAEGTHPFIKPDMTLREAGLIYSNGDPNWARNVALIMHVPQHTKMKDLIRGVMQEAESETTPSGRTGAWLKKAAGFAFRSFKKLWHVGDMKPKSKQPGSLEGSGLSVSVHPEDWKYIAEIGGPTWELTKPGNKFLNFHRLSKQQRKQITAWGVQNGYVEEVAIGWRWVYYDSEEDAERYMEFETEQEAREEMEGQGEGEVVPAKGSSMKGTDKLKQRTKNPRADDMVVAFDLLVTVYAEEELDCDGVWWEDTYDPASLSAPRGVIFAGKLKSWKARKIAAASAMMTFYHGTSAEAAKQIAQAGIEANPYVWATTDISTAESYARIKGERAGDDGAVVTFMWDYDNTEPDPEYGEIDAESNRRILTSIPRSAIKKIAADKSWTQEQAKTFLSSLPLAECGYSAKIVGSVETKGRSSHDLDVLLTPTSEEFDFEKLLNYFDSIGADTQPTYDGDEELWEVRLPSGQVVDFWFSEEGESKMAAEIFLYHGTSEDNWNLIMEQGGVLPARSYWGTERVAEYYAEDRAEAQTSDAIYNEMGTEVEEVIIRVPLSQFNKANLKPDDNSVAEPLTHTLKRSEEELYADWQKSKGTWQDSLRIYESVRYDAPITVTKANRVV